jgi:hypothetical protein
MCRLRRRHAQQGEPDVRGVREITAAIERRIGLHHGLVVEFRVVRQQDD